MACRLRERTGVCLHHQCEFSDQTEHGYECVDVVGAWCEVGDGCLEECPYSWPESDTEITNKAVRAFEDRYGE